MPLKNRLTELFRSHHEITQLSIKKVMSNKRPNGKALSVKMLLKRYVNNSAIHNCLTSYSKLLLTKLSKKSFQ